MYAGRHDGDESVIEESVCGGTAKFIQRRPASDGCFRIHVTVSFPSAWSVWNLRWRGSRARCGDRAPPAAQSLGRGCMVRCTRGVGGERREASASHAKDSFTFACSAHILANLWHAHGDQVCAVSGVWWLAVAAPVKEQPPNSQTKQAPSAEGKNLQCAPPQNRTG